MIKVKIISASPACWYSKSVGTVVAVNEEYVKSIIDEKEYYLVAGGHSYIRVDDTELLSESKPEKKKISRYLSSEYVE